MGTVLGLIGSVLSGLVQYVGLYFAFRTGVRRERQRNAENIGKVEHAQLEIAARPVEHRSELLDRMRNNGF
jgi:hypothetical protein